MRKEELKMRRPLSTYSARKPAVLHVSKPASRHKSGPGTHSIEKDEGLPETPFEEGTHDPLDADLRHRMISEMAYHLYRWRGYADGHDLDDWLKAETQIDNLTRMRGLEDDIYRGVSQTAPTGPRRGRCEP
jgi:hypothetical protein